MIQRLVNTVDTPAMICQLNHQGVVLSLIEPREFNSLGVNLTFYHKAPYGLHLPNSYHIFQDEIPAVFSCMAVFCGRRLVVPEPAADNTVRIIGLGLPVQPDQGLQGARLAS